MSPQFRLGLYAASVGLFVIGIAITGFAAYGEIDSTSYMIQTDHVGTSTDTSQVSYSSLTSKEKAVFDRVKGGGAAPVEGTALTTFANHAVQYKGDVYTFEWTYDPTTLTLIPFGFGVSIAIAGGALFFLTQFIVKRKLETSNVPA